jgi:hypothetical protein
MSHQSRVLTTLTPVPTRQVRKYVQVTQILLHLPSAPVHLRNSAFVHEQNKMNYTFQLQ